VAHAHELYLERFESDVVENDIGTLARSVVSGAKPVDQ
jgi:hypothetical protein